MHTVGDATSSVPAFLGKLWKLVEDPSTNHLISWNAVRRPFVITHSLVLCMLLEKCHLLPPLVINIDPITVLRNQPDLF